MLFYSLPMHGHYYAELVNMLDGGAERGTIEALFTPFDYLPLARILGATRASRVLKDSANSFLFT